MQFKKNLMLDYIAWLLKKYNEQQNKQNDIYRIADIKKSTSGPQKIVIQIIGKSVLVECTPQEIVSNDHLLEGFSKKDIRTITYLACEQIKKPKYRIVIQEFCEKLNGVLFKLRKQNQVETITKTANQIILDKELVDRLSREDIRSISYIAGYEHAQSEKLEMEMAKKKL